MSAATGPTRAEKTVAARKLRRALREWHDLPEADRAEAVAALKRASSEFRRTPKKFRGEEWPIGVVLSRVVDAAFDVALLGGTERP